MKGEDKKWLLIDSHFIGLSPDDHTMQSNSEKCKGADGFSDLIFRAHTNLILLS